MSRNGGLAQMKLLNGEDGREQTREPSSLQIFLRSLHVQEQVMEMLFRQDESSERTMTHGQITVDDT